ncbi:hypothetical protein NY78_0082 [Desulfovibrio sp. TomC]|nr:hypothetical protein NY78_0082 [Desulfovibrio sp. TomC]
MACLLALWSGAAVADGGSWELSATARSLGYRDMREPVSFTPSAAYVPQHGGWTRSWTEQRAFIGALYRVIDQRHVVVSAGGNIGTAVGVFEAKNVGQGFAELWQTKPALVWGPCARVVVRREPGQGVFARLEYAYFSAAAGEAREEVSSPSGTGTPPSARDAFFAWTSHEASAALGYDWGRFSASAGLSLIAFRLDKRLTHHVDPTGSSGNALAAILALNAFPSHYVYEPRSLVAPILSLTFRPTERLSLEGSIRPTDQPDVSLRLGLAF